MKITKKILFTFSILWILVTGGLFLVGQAQAGSLWEAQMGTEEIAAAYGNTGEEPADPRDIIVQLIKIFLSILGIVFLIMVIYGGFTWMTAGGSSERVDNAKKTIVRSIIGVIIVLLSYIITDLVTSCVLGMATGSALDVCT